jgi:hypothetical protein
MAEIVNSKVFDSNKKFVDLAGLDYFWEKAKAYVDGVDSAMSGRVDALADVVGDSTKGLVKDLATLQETVNSLGNIEGGEGIGGMIDAKIAALDLPNTYDSKGSAAAAEAAAKSYVDGIVNDKEVEGETVKGLNSRIASLESIDHEKLASDASAAAVATILDGAPEAFNTLKEVADWIGNNDHASDVATLVTDVANLKAIDHDAYKGADETVLSSAKSYADGVANTAKSEAIADADSKIAGLSSVYDSKGSAAAAETAAKSYTDGKLVDYTKTDAMNTAIETAKNAAIAAANETLKSYYTSSQVDTKLAENSAADQAYAKTYAESYTNQLFDSIGFATTTDIDSMSSWSK